MSDKVESLDARYAPILKQIRDKALVVPTDMRERSIFELKLLAIRAYGFAKGRRGRDLHLTPDGEQCLRQYERA